jgi:hypothetical protein
MLSAIVVNKPNVGTGTMEPETLKGFIAAARDLGYSVSDEEEFLREQQDRCVCLGQSRSHLGGALTPRLGLFDTLGS